jgi:hypothetical protein
MREPYWPLDCECKYDDKRDEMDREDCPFHSEFQEEAPVLKALPSKPPKFSSVFAHRKSGLRFRF